MILSPPHLGHFHIISTPSFTIRVDGTPLAFFSFVAVSASSLCTSAMPPSSSCSGSNQQNPAGCSSKPCSPNSQWYWDQEVFDFFGDHLHLIDPEKLSVRAYVKAYERKPKGDWKEFITRRYFTQSGEQWVLALESNPKFGSVDERVAAFVKHTGLGRSTDLHLQEAIEGRRTVAGHYVPRLTLTGPPEALSLEAEGKALAEQERRAQQRRIEQQEEQDYQDLEDRFFGEDDDE